MVPKKWQEKMEIRGRTEAIQTRVFFDRFEYREESWRPDEACCHWDSSESPPANTVK